MSIKQKALKVLGFLAIVGAVDLSITVRVLFTSAEITFEPLHLLSIVLSVAFSLAMGIMGVIVSNKPAKVSKLFIITLLALWANFCDVFLFALNGDLVPSPIINFVIVIAFTYMAHQVKRELGNL